eukprot:scaffold11512_cov63-Phaeocystis_antarctica.AAC.5
MTPLRLHLHSPGVPAHLRRAVSSRQAVHGKRHGGPAHLRAGCGGGGRAGAAEERQQLRQLDVGQLNGRDRAAIRREQRAAAELALLACGLHGAAPLDGLGDDGGGAAH